MRRIICSLAVAAITITSCSAQKKAIPETKTTFDFEAHRGGRGLMPENTIPAMKHAIELNVTTLEMDVVISKDRKVVVSHDAYFNDIITTAPGGKTLSKKEAEDHLLYAMPYDSIRMFDVGIKPHPGFPQQKKLNTYKPLLSELIDSVEAFSKGKGKSMKYNIEIKSREGFDGIRHPDTKTFSEMLIAVLNEKKILNRTIIQSFDTRPLEYIHKTYPSITLSYLVDKISGSLQDQLNRLTFIPKVFSPVSSIVTKDIVAACHAKGMAVIPWTVNTVKEMNDLAAMGVDGIISDYPDLFTQVRVKQ